MSVFASEPLEKVSLQLKWKYQFQFAGFIMAKEKGFYKDVGLDVDLIEFEDDINIIGDVKSGKTDFAISDSSLVYEGLKNESVTAMMAVFQHTPFVLFGLKSSGIKKLQDINEKKIALYKDMNGVAIETMLKSNGIDYIGKAPIYTLDKLLSGEVDMMMGYISNEPFVAKSKNIEVIIFEPKKYGFEGYGDILFTSHSMIKNNPIVVEKMYEATQRGWKYAFSHIEETVDLIYEKYNTLDKTKEALLYEANSLKELSGYEKNFGNLDKEKIKSIAQQFNVMKKENNKLSNLDNFIYEPLKKETKLFSDEELNYLKKKKTIKVCIDIQSSPFSMLENEKLVGLSIDMLELVLKTSKIPFEFIQAISRKDHFEMLKNQQCDVVPLVVYKPNVFDFLTPTTPYGGDIMTLLTRVEEPYSQDLKSTLKGKKIGMFGQNKNVIKYAKDLYPDIEVVELKSIDLSKVADGSLFGVIASSLQVSYKIASKYSTSLKVLSQVGEKKIRASFGVSNSEPILLNILNKAIDETTQKQRQEIFNAWYHVKVDDQINRALIIKIVLGFLVILFIVTLFVLTLRKNNKKLHKLLNSTLEGMVVTKNDICIDINNQALKLLGYKHTNEIKGKNVLDFVALTCKSIVMKERYVDGKPYECDLLKKDGTVVSVLMKGTFFSEDKEVRVSSFLDLTELKSTQNKLEILNKSLEDKVEIEVEKNQQQQLMLMQQSRLAQMGEMISMIAHQWRQPLSTLSMIIQGTVFKHRRGLLDANMIQQLDKNSKIQISQMSDTIDDFRNFFKPEKKSEWFNVPDTIAKSISLISPSFIDGNIKFELNIQENIIFIGFPNELGQSLINILNNAKDALIQNNADEEKIIKISLKDFSDRIVLHVEDNAGGIPADIMDDIFNPYFSTKTDKNGTGLGLYMTKIIIEEHMSGKIRVINTEDGASFRITLLKKEDK